PFRPPEKFTRRDEETLLNYFDKGLARVLGSTNSDCYHLFCFSRNRSPRRSNCTLMIMNSLDDNDKRMLFFKEGDRTASDVTKFCRQSLICLPTPAPWPRNSSKT
uniref:DUF3591 domain-containing protein n=1 Tax=Macrostomum lignano TaxID=282301 RepID=A0A1I8FIU4_9PLAT